MPTYFIHNPVSGKSDAGDLLDAIKTQFEGHAEDFEHLETRANDSIPDFVRAAVDRGFDLIVAAGFPTASGP